MAGWDDVADWRSSFHPAIFARLELPAEDALRELVTEAWLARAPARLAAAYTRRPS